MKLLTAKSRAMCEPIMGPEPTMKMGPDGAIVVRWDRIYWGVSDFEFE